MRFSVVIPTLNEELSLPGTLDAVRRLGSRIELIVADGGSKDRTVDIAQSYGATIVHAGQGRGSQQAAGAELGTGEVLWFLHADSIPAPDSLAAIERAFEDAAVVGGSFTLQFDGARLSARQLTFVYPYLRLLGLCYGDSGIFARTEAYRAIGGFRPFPLFEDVDLVRRLKGAGKFVRLDCRLTTSSRRFERRNFALVFAHWTLLQVLYWMGVSPHRLARMYAPVRK
jgi:rSAM/selenodomain-associated transferase 2